MPVCVPKHSKNWEVSWKFYDNKTYSPLCLFQSQIWPYWDTITYVKYMVHSNHSENSRCKYHPESELSAVWSSEDILSQVKGYENEFLVFLLLLKKKSHISNIKCLAIPSFEVSFMLLHVFITRRRWFMRQRAESILKYFRRFSGYCLSCSFKLCVGAALITLEKK